MYRGATIGVVVPAYNEEEFVGDVIETVPAFVDRVYVVDDCSTDGSWNEIRETFGKLDGSQPTHDGVRPVTDGAGAIADGTGAIADGAGGVADGGGVRWRDRIVAHDVRDGSGRPDRRFVAFRHRENAGVGGAIKTGYRNAMNDPADVDVVAVMSGDGQMDPTILDRIIDPVVRGDADYAKGNRLRHTDFRREMSTWRTFGNFLLTGLTRVASGYWRMMDPQNGYTAISRRALDRVEFESLYEDYGFCNHLLVRLNRQRLRIADVSMKAVYGDETSYIRYETFVPALSLLLLRGYLGRLLDADGHGLGEPTAAAQLLGMGAIVGGVGVGALFPLLPAATSTGGILVLVGLVSFLTGVVGEKRRNVDLEVRADSGGPPWKPRIESEEVPPRDDPPAREE
ncbi:glycosyltransferase family 2 protein [Halorubrum cibi]|uniref:X-X-X-Leu-X-X-Gly heptad repeat-containing protein n=1 Tax=Halorubrum cibi TaxID=413815 RepID=A0A521C3L5_9EURY|nr:glycosyltransferase family 2 protein [Halorubrum cibi]SMO53994.1 X-X-X-Leu-X-X-Gly heptad repeat-containing protein [Halorubrum cibi]